MIKVKILKESKNLLNEGAPSKEEALATLSSNSFRKSMFYLLKTSNPNSSEEEIKDNIDKIVNYIGFLFRVNLTDLSSKEAGLSILWIKKLLTSDNTAGRSARYNFSAQNLLYIGHVTELLESYFTLMRPPTPNFIAKQGRDLMQVAGLNQLFTLVSDGKAEKKEYEKEVYERSTPRYTDYGTFGKWSIKTLENKKAACQFGSKKWCTALKDLDHFQRYHQDNSPLIFISNINDPTDIYQIGFLQGQFMNKDNVTMDQSIFTDILTALKASKLGSKYPDITKTNEWITGELKK